MGPQAGDGFCVRSLAVTYREGHTSSHTHPWAQLIYAKTGLMCVEAGGSAWFVPPTKAVWIPSRTPHRITFSGEVALRTLYVPESCASAIDRTVQTLEVAPLLSHLIVHIQSIGMLDPRIPEHEHLAAVLVDLVCAAPGLDLVLPHPEDPRALGLARHLRANPADRTDLRTLAGRYGASLRTMQRRFSDETGLALDTWRQKARLVHAVAALTGGATVSSTAVASGYESASAFIAAFKKHFGMTPGRLGARDDPSAEPLPRH